MSTQTPKPPRAAGKKGDPPKREQTRDNLSKPEPMKIVPLNFRIPAEIKRNFKIAAATHGITQSQLLVEAFQEWNSKRS